MSKRRMKYHSNDEISYYNFLHSMKDKIVTVYRGGPESKKGRLVWLGDDYAALNTNEDGVVYFNIHHIKSISKHEPDLKIEGQTPSGVLEADYLSEVFKSLTHKWVSINRGGPEAIEGILVDNADGHYTIVKNQEVLRIYPFHIKSISLGPKGSYKKEDQKNEQSQEDNNDKDSNSFISSKSYSSSKSSKRSLKSSDYQSSKSYSSSRSKSSSKSSKRSPRSSDYQSSKSYSSSGSKSSSKSSKRSPRSSDYQSSRSPGYSSSIKSSGKQKEDYSYETIVRTIDYHWKRKF